MIVFTIIGLLWFWNLCFWIGYGLIPAVHVVRAELAVLLFGHEAERVMAIFAIAATNRGVGEVPRG